MKLDYDFDHEGLDVYHLAVEVARWAASQVFPSHRRHLRSQLLRSCDTAVLCIAEGRAQVGDARRNHYTVAHSSAAEACSVLDLIDLPGGPENQQKLRRVGAMLASMRRK